MSTSGSLSCPCSGTLPPVRCLSGISPASAGHLQLCKPFAYLYPERCVSKVGDSLPTSIPKGAWRKWAGGSGIKAIHRYNTSNIEGPKSLSTIIIIKTHLRMHEYKSMGQRHPLKYVVDLFLFGAKFEEVISAM
jgi:hypothetical protein